MAHILSIAFVVYGILALAGILACLIARRKTKAAAEGAAQAAAEEADRQVMRIAPAGYEWMQDQFAKTWRRQYLGRRWRRPRAPG